MSKAKPREPSYIDPACLYSLRGFQNASGITPTRICEARRCGIELHCLSVGKRKFVRGSDGIEYIERLAENCSVKKLANC